MFSSTMRAFTLAAIASIVLFSAQTEAASKKGLAWATDNRWAKKIAKGQISWYHHWQDAPVSEMPNDVEYIPMYWGPRYNHLWNQRKKHFKKKMPKYVLAFNEPDVDGQANMSPSAAASLYMSELEPLRKKGVKVSSPQIVWNTKWMDSFMKKIKARGGDVDFMAIHYYGSWKDQKRLQKWVKTIRKKYGKDIWLTEYGVTAASHGSAAQIRNFREKVTAWMDKVGYVDRVAWLGCFAVNNPPDAYASAKNAMFNSGGTLNKMAYSYMYKRGETSPQPMARSTPGAKRHSLQHHKRIIANGLQQAADIVRRNETESTINGYPATEQDIEEYLAATDDDTTEEGDSVDCDEICQMRDAETEGTDADDEDDLE